jgi:hypothetical protein
MENCKSGGRRSEVGGRKSEEGTFASPPRMITVSCPEKSRYFYYGY